MTGGVNFYRATPLHPPTATEAAHALPDQEAFRVRRPVRVIWGDDDRALTPSLVEGLPDVCDDLEVVRIPEGSHWIAHEQPERVSRLIRDFLAR